MTFPWFPHSEFSWDLAEARVTVVYRVNGGRLLQRHNFANRVLGV